MSAFGCLDVEKILQVNDKTRLNAVKTYAPKGQPAITKVEIEPDTGAGFIEVSGTGTTYKDWYLDWQYATDGFKTVTLRVTQGANPPETFTASIQVFTEDDDFLYSTDQDLKAKVHDILNYVPPGRNSFKNVHRNAQSLILDWLNDIRVWKNDGSQLEKKDLMLTENLRKMSTYWTLALIYDDLSNKVDDVFLSKSRAFMEQAQDAKLTNSIAADFDGDGDPNEEGKEKTDMRTMRMVRR